ncbi:Uncharacterised protein [Legionella donaldsonii]|uniref:Uncharacterized protein n=1 Tax=Legionella donaldsonii TaxID=45060 RepID=A0A378J914_9GAMM|nr:hypothetical protein [Legionella donaldsonii]STX43949.1 Uncharacterised protein [Legionella donaldsonii]
MTAKKPNPKEEHIKSLYRAEMQFRLMVSVRLACSLQNQPLNVPDLWIFGNNQLEGREIQLNMKEANKAAAFLEHAITYAWSIHAYEAILKCTTSSDRNDESINAAYQISRYIRHAYTHNPYIPIWSFQDEDKNKRYEIPNIIRLNTSNLHKEKLKWQDYGGFITLWNLSRWIRLNILDDRLHKIHSREHTYVPSGIIQLGRLILKKIEIDKMPSDDKKIGIETVEITGEQYGIIARDSDGIYTVKPLKKIK